ncbi:MAG TPA: methyltransferase domain-containing protein, partial [Holophagaceae bacterium]
MFTSSAHLYDLVYDAVVDYDERCEEMHKAIRKRNPRARTLLEVGCGTGRNLERLRAHYEVAGIDVSPAMAALCTARLPAVPVAVADMADFDLGRRFDAVICPFSSIG